MKFTAANTIRMNEIMRIRNGEGKLNQAYKRINLKEMKKRQRKKYKRDEVNEIANNYARLPSLE